MIASNNRLREKLAEFQRDITALNKIHEQEMLRLSNEHEKDMKLLEIMQGIINKIDSLNQFLICEHGEHQKVDELHAQLIHYQQTLLALTSKVNNATLYCGWGYPSSWFWGVGGFFDVETEKEKERQNTLKKDIKDYTHKAQQAKKRHKHQQTLKIADHCLNIIQRYLQEIERLQQEKKETPTQLKAVLEQIQQEMKSLPIQQKHALQIYYNRFEDAQRRALAYLDYLSRLKTQLQEKEKRLKSDLGEIKKLKQKVKENEKDIKKHQEALEQFEEWRDESQSNNPKNAVKMQEWMDERQEKIDRAWHFINKTQSRIKKKECAIDEILKHIQTMEPNYLLPQDFLYVGKLACVNKSEIYAHDKDEKSNIYGQRLSLESGEHEKSYGILITLKRNFIF
ncbi:hypothetical protein [Helicobacter pylori]|uniref:hypothetical protein n=1 Tax=Helicobacter pylori TaxID=210 RepID=UPI0009BC786F|nr:hypothetical protein [Helicobacter pylori]KAF0998823.1 hypothetical protein HP10700_05614 [Helicobacter pylori 10700]AQM66006.1 hypothetical protein HPYLSS1_00740 [Helicobacter pylori SS1]AQM72220.1 hypothetical protein HPYLPMSS1_00740 [Helicobacter pylori PMSS1]KAF0997189.1 hypothetical protein HPYSS1_08340 [Helicobacter pylori SS1]KAF0999570.1 hypothetical protein HPSS1190_02725 [Helicobacter pylori SS1_190]